GGGVYVTAATLNIQNTTIANNFADNGAGLDAVASHVTITNSTIANNHGNGISTFSSFSSASSLSLQSSTLSGNTVSNATRASDIYLYNSSSSTLTVTLHDTILNGTAGNP